ncbi:MAG: hypothetical protein N4A35_14560 [Flavobacteriales bacterium]|jgi:hypothetical protein|nr:hypothetical protein [Flavobacteriales bacterium]
MKTTADTMKKEHSTWLKRIGVVGFLFFLIKGILWLIALWAGYSLF